eukprot:Skav215646  [mRNA]  locus=scaffold736:350901:354057:+ [translate_table: standard]
MIGVTPEGPTSPMKFTKLTTRPGCMGVVDIRPAEGVLASDGTWQVGAGMKGQAQDRRLCSRTRTSGFFVPQS